MLLSCLGQLAIALLYNDSQETTQKITLACDEWLKERRSPIIIDDRRLIERECWRNVKEGRTLTARY